MKENFEEYDYFIDDKGTTYQKIDDEGYDYKLTDNFGVDYCTISQMKDWKVKVDKILKLEEV